MIRVAIVEDDEIYAKQLADYLYQYGQENKEAFEISYFMDGDNIVNGYKAKYDIILMDIQMKFMDGMSAAEEIRRMDSEVILIFVTSVKQYAIRGYAVDAMDYIIKPISYFNFSQRIMRAIERIQKKKAKTILLNVRGGIIRINASDIYYVESQRHILIYHTAHGIYELNRTMREAEEMLKDESFFRANKGYLINLAYVESVKDDCAIVKGETLIISRSRKKKFMEMLTIYWTGV